MNSRSEKKIKNIGGSVTVEISCIMPIIIFIMLFILHLGIGTYKNELISAITIDTAKLGAIEYRRILAHSPSTSWNPVPTSFQEKLSTYVDSKLQENGVDITVEVEITVIETSNETLIKVVLKHKDKTTGEIDYIIASSTYQVIENGSWIAKLSGK